MSISVFNRCWSKVILETLVRQGVAHFVLHRGSRSTPLTLEAIRLQDSHRVTCHTHFDERGLGFCIGTGKSQQKACCRDRHLWHGSSESISCYY